MSQSWPCTTILQKRVWQEQRPGDDPRAPQQSTHPLPLTNSARFTTSKKVYDSHKKKPFPPKWASPCSLTPKPERHALRHVYAVPIERTHTTNFQKGKITQQRPLSISDLKKQRRSRLSLSALMIRMSQRVILHH
jgi:hypothetical protein